MTDAFNTYTAKRNRLAFRRTYGTDKAVYAHDPEKLYHLTVGVTSVTLSDEDLMGLFDHYLALRQEYVDAEVLIANDED